MNKPAQKMTIEYRMLYVYASAVVFFLLSGSAAADTPCSCSPSTYTLTIDFSNPCQTIDNPSPGILSIYCEFQGTPGNGVVDLTPNFINILTVTEYDANFVGTGLMYTDIFSLADGDSIIYMSAIINHEYAGAPVMMIYISIEATNASGETFTLDQYFQFSNDCATYPMLTAGDNIGWLDLVSFPWQCGCGVQLSASVHPFLWCKPIYLILTHCSGICIIYFLFATL